MHYCTVVSGIKRIFQSIGFTPYGGGGTWPGSNLETILFCPIKYQIFHNQRYPCDICMFLYHIEGPCRRGTLSSRLVPTPMQMC